MNGLKRLWYRFFPREFRVGDKVYCSKFDEYGIVDRLDYNNNPSFPLVVVRPGRVPKIYTLKGHYYKGQTRPDLVWIGRVKEEV